MVDTRLYTTINHLLAPKSVDPDHDQPKTWKWAVRDESDTSKFDTEIPVTDRPITYDFTLDDFQRRAVSNIWKGRHVFVSAHTSAGKTITAEWAIALSLSLGRRAVYTSPIKALSNQKFRDFRVKFNHIDVEECYNDPYEEYYDDEFDSYGGGGGAI